MAFVYLDFTCRVYCLVIDPSPLPGGDVHSWDRRYLELLVVARAVSLHTLLVQWSHQLYPVHVCVCVCEHMKMY